MFKNGGAAAGGKGGHGKNKPQGKKSQGKQKRQTATQHNFHGRRKVEITFNPADRLNYLTGFSSRKQERRAFGLAMQKVKDREARLEENKEAREAQLEKIEEIERNKKALRGVDNEGGYNDDEFDINDNSADGKMPARPLHQHNEKELKTFQDEHTTNQFGGLVSVTTTFGIPSDDEDDNSINSKRVFYARKQHGAGHVDEAQKRAGDVHKYITEVKGTMNQSKKGTSKQGGKKGQHGASTMKGMGNAKTLNMAKKTLSKFQAKGAKGAENERGGKGKGKKKKGRR